MNYKFDITEDEHTLQIEQTTESMAKTITRMLFDIRQKAIVDFLIKRGWTPPAGFKREPEPTEEPT